MSIDADRKYFHLSFRFNRTSPSDFGLSPTDDPQVFRDKSEGTLWLQRELYDFGWGQEYGFVRLPQLDFEQLWYLLLNSTLQENRYGAAAIIEEHHSDSLLKRLRECFSDTKASPSESEKQAFQILRLVEGGNRSNTVGKSWEEIASDAAAWEQVADRARNVLCDEAENVPGRHCD